MPPKVGTAGVAKKKKKVNTGEAKLQQIKNFDQAENPDDQDFEFGPQARAWIEEGEEMEEDQEDQEDQESVIEIEAEKRVEAVNIFNDPLFGQSHVQSPPHGGLFTCFLSKLFFDGIPPIANAEEKSIYSPLINVNLKFQRGERNQT
ncbi:hypothetical protein QFC22_005303 [Naganishia vaughanmartiniae]|uniref:Uncharacterized protein n=1 Tax=Naganishia vaughanmartiniae TaxID=1424756 RepID=A0ACC2WUX8_9TREE|nr:hypothetical protein QFC22_005303 [Naganishia vaughanmartiniae]